MSAARLLLTMMVGVLLLGSAACGRRGELETPYSAAVEARREAAENNEALPPEPVKPVEDKPFILDPLL